MKSLIKKQRSGLSVRKCLELKKFFDVDLRKNVFLGESSPYSMVRVRRFKILLFCERNNVFNRFAKVISLENIGSSSEEWKLIKADDISELRSLDYTKWISGINKLWETPIRITPSDEFKDYMKVYYNMTYDNGYWQKDSK